MFGGVVVFALLLAVIVLLTVGFIRAMIGKSSSNWDEGLSPDARAFLPSKGQAKEVKNQE